MKIEQMANGITVRGCALRTHNGEAFDTIPAHWARFMGGGGLAQIPGCLDGDIYAVYTQFEHQGMDNHGLYTLVIGGRVGGDEAAPPGLVQVHIPPGRKAVFPVPAGRFDLVGACWQRIWSDHSIDKSFHTDHEHYHSHGEIEIHVGLR